LQQVAVRLSSIITVQFLNVFVLDFQENRRKNPILNGVVSGDERVQFVQIDVVVEEV
jgi:hypothetical protein